jgi:serine/threonine-protein kinase
MICAACNTTNDEESDACFTCGKALYVLTQGMLLAGRYEILSAIGTGGMGRVYKGHDRVLDEDVAIKVLRFEISREQDMARRFLSEIKLARRVSHPNVCRIHEYGEHAGIRFISMEYIDGLTLKEFLRGGFLSREAAFDVAIQAAQGLQAVHDMGVIHRDFKASNIMIDSRGVARLVDFGIAKHAEHDATSSGAVFGTPEYMSPEQVRGGRLDYRSDIYALGCVVYEIFAGQAPFRGENPMETVMKQLHDPLPLETVAARRLPASVIPVVQKAVAKAPDDRYARVSDMKEALKAARRAEGLEEPDTRPLAASLRTADAAAGVPAVASGGRAALASASAPRVVVAEAAATPRPRTHETTTLHRQRDAADRRGPTAPGPRRSLVLWGAVAASAVAGVVWLSQSAPARPAGPVAAPSSVPAAATAPPSLVAAPPATFPIASHEAAPETAAASPRASPRAAAPPDAVPSTAPGRPPTPAPASPGILSTPPPAVVVTSAGPAASVETGTLRLSVHPESEVVLDGTSLGRLSMRDLTLEAGPHTVRVVHPDYEPLQRKVTVRPGAATQLVLDLAEKAIRKEE